MMVHDTEGIHKDGLLTLVERKTQLSKITKLPRATARATQKAAVRRLKPIGNFVHTITFDNGKEFAAHQDIAHALKAKIFFATPYHAWERGWNENTNGTILEIECRILCSGTKVSRPMEAVFLVAFDVLCELTVERSGHVLVPPPHSAHHSLRCVAPCRGTRWRREVGRN